MTSKCFIPIVALGGVFGLLACVAIDDPNYLGNGGGNWVPPVVTADCVTAFPASEIRRYAGYTEEDCSRSCEQVVEFGPEGTRCYWDGRVLTAPVVPGLTSRDRS